MSAKRRGGRWLSGAGLLSIALGLSVLGYGAFQLWGTDLVTASHQRSLRQGLEQEFAASGFDDPVLGDRPTANLVAAPQREPRPIPGDALGLLRIPEIGLNVAFVEGVGAGELQMGPGHYPGTAMPGQGGNVSIAGHRTTYGRPFWSLDELSAGDRIFVRTRGGRFVYRVQWAGVVTPDRLDLIAPTAEPSLTLTTCNPRFSSSQRLVVRAVQVEA